MLLPALKIYGVVIIGERALLAVLRLEFVQKHMIAQLLIHLRQLLHNHALIHRQPVPLGHILIGVLAHPADSKLEQ